MRLLFSLVLIALLACQPAMAAGKSKRDALTAATQETQTSTLSRPVFEPDGRFGFCLAEHTYTDGRKLTIAQSPAKQINLGLTIPNAGFKPGGKYDLLLSLEHEAGRKNRAVAISEESILLQMGTNQKFRNKMTTSKTLEVGPSGKMISFDLPDTAAMFSALDQCLQDNKGKVSAKAAAAEQAMPETLKALLVTAGFTDIVPMDLGKVPLEERPADFIWQTGHLLAGIRERRAPDNKTLSDLVGLHIQGLKNRCTGSFKVDIEKEKKVKDLSLTLAQATCSPKDDTRTPAITVSLLFYLTTRGGFTVFTHEGHIAVKEETIAARDKLAKTIVSLAEER